MDTPKPPDESSEDEPGEDRWRPVEYGKADPDETWRSLDTEPELDETEDESVDASFDAEKWSRVPKWREGGKAWGLLVDSDGLDVWVKPIPSGYDGPSMLVHPEDMALSPGWVVFSHVEAHAAATMRINEATGYTLYVNRIPCPGQFGCDELLPDMLPADSTLTVYAPDGFCKTYIGVSQEDRL